MNLKKLWIIVLAIAIGLAALFIWLGKQITIKNPIVSPGTQSTPQVPGSESQTVVEPGGIISTSTTPVSVTSAQQSTINPINLASNANQPPNIQGSNIFQTAPAQPAPSQAEMQEIAIMNGLTLSEANALYSKYGFINSAVIAAETGTGLIIAPKQTQPSTNQPSPTPSSGGQTYSIAPTTQYPNELPPSTIQPSTQGGTQQIGIQPVPGSVSQPSTQATPPIQPVNVPAALQAAVSHGNVKQ